MSRGRIAVLVSNDLTYDQRVRKTCATLQQAGWTPVLVGRRMSRSEPRTIDRPYDTLRMDLPARRGPVFYASLQWALTRTLARLHRSEPLSAIWANDLDTLWPAVLFARRFGLEMAYDSHEWFTEAEGLKGKPIRRAIWHRLQRHCFRSIDRMLTVNASIAEAYRKEGLAVEVVPNVPERAPKAVPADRAALGWPTDRTVLIMQGAFMDRDRGALDAVRAMVHVSDCHLALIGAGPEHEQAGALAARLGIADRVHVHDRLPFEELRRCTAAADVGLSLDRPTVLNFQFSLPNKLFDYLHADLPVVCSDLPVAGRFVREEQVGVVAEAAQGEEAIARSIAAAVGRLLASPPKKTHLAAVAERHHWGAYADALLGAVHRPH